MLSFIPYKLKYFIVAAAFILALCFETTIELAEDIVILIFQAPVVLLVIFFKPMFQILSKYGKYMLNRYRQRDPWSIIITSITGSERDCRNSCQETCNCQRSSGSGS